jgi:hypothetical protein
VASCPIPESVIGSGVASGVGVAVGASGACVAVSVAAGVGSGVGASGAGVVGVAGGASGVSGDNMPIMNKIANAYTTYPNILVIRFSLRIKGNLSFIPISFSPHVYV